VEEEGLDISYRSQEEDSELVGLKVAVCLSLSEEATAVYRKDHIAV
jgi:hypothetical protein